MVVEGGKKEKMLVKTISERIPTFVTQKTDNATVTPTVTRTNRRCEKHNA